MTKPIFVVFLFAFWCCLDVTASYGQSCRCPTLCSTCVGGVIEYSLQYQGEDPVIVTVFDERALIFNASVSPGDVFVVSPPQPAGRFAGQKIEMVINGKKDTDIDVRCTSNTYVNSKFGSFVIVAGKRADGKALCCSPGGVNDNISPLFFIMPSDTVVKAEAGRCGAVVSWRDAVAKDCNLAEVIVDYEPGSEFPIGVTRVTYRATDEEGNETERSFTVTVVDDQIPSFTSCPANLNLTTTVSDGAVATWSMPLSTDNCGVTSLESTHLSGSVFPPGETVVMYTARDAAGLTTTCSFTVVVTVVRSPDTEPEPPPAGESPPLIVGKIITPDGDGKNDYWMLENIDHYPDNRVLVLDRWGGTVFSASGYNNDNVSWNGGSASGKLPGGTYFYVISYRRADRVAEEKGFIELIP